MLNIGRLAPGGEDYYLQTVAAGVEDYYTGSGEAPGQWLTESAADLGLSGQVEPDDLQAVLAAQDPASRDPLGSARGGRKVPGFDCTFRAPKSVSLLWGLGDEATAAAVRDAHDAAVAAALGYLAAHAGYSRRGAGGAEAVAVEGLVAAGFRHRSSRAGDPLLHTHVLVANLARAVDDGKWRTLDARRLYTHAKTAGYLYQTALRDELTRRLDVQWQPVRNGCADLAGIPDDLIAAFSQRRAEILERMAQRGESSAKAAQTATLATRKAKDYGVAPASLTDAWRDRAAQHGFTAEHVAALMGRTAGHEVDVAQVATELAGPQGLTAHASTFTRREVIQAWCERLPAGASIEHVEALADALLHAEAGVAVELPAAGTADGHQPGVRETVEAVAGHCDTLGELRLSGSPSVARSIAALLEADWTSADVAAALTERELASAQDPVAVLAWRAQRLAAAHGVTGEQRRLDGAAVIRRSDGRVVAAARDEARYSTPELLALERQVIDAAVGRRHAGVAVAEPAAVRSALAARPTVTGEQAAMVRRLTGSGAGVEVVVGKAGAGKTFALDAARQAWQASGVRVVGCALAARAAVELGESAGIDSYTIDALLADVQRPGPAGGLAAGSVLVIDEAGMAGTRKLARLAEQVQAADAKLVLVGDHHQLPEVDAGGLFRGLVARLPVIELADNRRQQQAWERAALDELRDGQPGAALAAYAAHDRVVVGDNAEAVREQLVGDWWAARDEHDTDGIMIAARRSDVADLNARARARMAADGQLTGPELVTADGNAFAVGDDVVALHNDRRLGVVNGSRGRVEAIDLVAASVAVRLTDGRSVTLPGGYLADGHLTHGYALTGHKAQGLTTTQAWVLGSDASYREWGYVAMSRGRDGNRLYVVAGDEPTAEDAHTPAVVETDPLAAARRAWERSHSQQLAIDQGEVDTAAANVPVDELARRRADLATQLRHAAPAATGRRARGAVEEREAARAQLAAAQQRHTTARERLAATPGGLRPSRRAQRAQSQQTLRRRADEVSLWQQRVAELDQRLAQLQASPRGDRPQRDGDVVAAHTVDAALVQVARRRAQAAEFDPPGYLTAALGHRPEGSEARRRWRRAVDAIEAYRVRYGITDRLQALGERPSERTQRDAYQQAAAALSAGRQAQAEHELSVEAVREPDLELGLG